MIVLNQILLKVSNLNEPGGDCLVDQGSVTSPTIRIVMNLCSALDNSSFLLNVLNNDLVSVLDINTLISWTFICELSILINWHWWVIWIDDSLTDTDLVIFLTKTWSAVDNTGTRVLCDEISSNNLKATVFLSVNKEIEHWYVLFTFQILTFKLLKNFKSLLVLSIKSLSSAFSQNEDLISFGIFDLDVIHLWLDS